MYLFKAVRKQTIGINNIINVVTVPLLLTLNSYQHLVLASYSMESVALY